VKWVSWGLKLLFLINIFLAAGFLISGFAPKISPVKSDIPFLFGIIFPYLLIINVLFLLYWISTSKLYWILSGAVIALNYSGINALFALNFEEKPGFNEKNISIQVFNVRAFNQFRWINHDQVGDSIMNYITEQNADVVLFQEFLDEINGRSKYISTLQKRGYNYYHHEPPGAMFAKKDQVFGMVTFSKFPIISAGNLYHPLHPRKAKAIFSDIDIGGDTVRFYNIHLNSVSMEVNDYLFIKEFGRGFSDATINYAVYLIEKILRSARERAAEVEMIRNHQDSCPYDYILVGDFNEPPHTYAYTNILGDDQDAFLEAGLGLGHTYLGGANMPSMRLDYVLGSSNIKWTSYRTDHVKLSDHYPIQASFTLP
jgi:endonuclease/exonuclease/phosphatase family metal-dependent hydrolase